MSSKVSSKKLTIRYLLYQVAYYATCVGTSAFATTYLLEKGFSTSSIGIVIAATNILSCILQPMLGDVVDRLKKFVLPQMMIGFLASALVCFAVIQFCKPSLGIFGILYGMGLLLISITVSLNNSLCAYYLQNGYPINYGMGIGVGSFTFSVFSFAMGYWLVWFGMEFMLWFAFASLTAQMIIVAGYPKLSNGSFTQNVQEEKEGSDRVSILAFFGKYKLFSITLLGVMLLATSHCMMENYLINIFEAMGGGSENVGIALSVASLAATPVLIYFEKIQKKTGILMLIKLAGVFFSCKALLLLLATESWNVYLIQLLQTVTFGFSFPALFYFVKLKISEADMAKGQAVAAVVFTLGTAIGSFIGGRVIDQFGIKAMIMTALALAVFGTLVIYMTVQKDEKRDE